MVIPKGLRDEFGILPGENVIFEDAGDAILIKKPRRDAAEMFAAIARVPSKKVKPWHPCESEEEIEEKLGRIGLFRCLA